MKGQLIKELQNGHKEAGNYEVIFDATGLASGVYIYQINAGSFNKVKTMLLLK